MTRRCLRAQTRRESPALKRSRSSSWLGREIGNARSSFAERLKMSHERERARGFGLTVRGGAHGRCSNHWQCSSLALATGSVGLGEKNAGLPITQADAGILHGWHAAETETARLNCRENSGPRFLGSDARRGSLRETETGPGDRLPRQPRRRTSLTWPARWTGKSHRSLDCRALILPRGTSRPNVKDERT